jgi:hypothetical protein
LKNILIVPFFLATLCCRAQSADPAGMPVGTGEVRPGGLVGLSGSPGSAGGGVGPGDSVIELRFQLIEKKSSGNLSLDVQIINHSARDIYIPYLNYLTFHLYEQSDSGWNELDLYSHRVYPRKGKFQQSHMDIRDRDNDLSRYYKASIDQYYYSQKAIIDSFYAQNPGANKLANVFRPVFLKAGETLNYFEMIPMDYIRQQPKMYKISFGTEQRDASLINGSKELALLLPERVLHYTRYLPKTILANTIYYSAIE